MSICICIQNERGLMIGADTAITEDVNGVRYRRYEQYEKVRVIGDFAIFGSGMAGVMNNVYAKFSQTENKTIESLREIVIQSCEDFKQENPKLYEETDEHTRDVAVLAATMEDGKAVVYIMTPKDNFTLQKTITPPGRSIPHVGGYYSEEASEYVGHLMRNGAKADKAIIETIRHFSGSNVGGNIILVKLDESGIQSAPPIPTLETVSIPYYAGGYLEGSSFSTGFGAYPYCEISSETIVFTAAKSPTSYIKIEANPASYAGPIIKHVDGNTIAFTGAMGGDYFSLVSGGDYDIGAQDGAMRISGGNVQINGNFVTIPSDVYITMPYSLHVANTSSLYIGNTTLGSILSGIYSRLSALESQ